jgi:hypothetical protein
VGAALCDASSIPGDEIGSRVRIVINLQPATVPPIGEFTLKAQALGDLEARDDAPLDLLAGFASSFAGPPILPAGLIEVGNKAVALDGCRLKQVQ